jgi:hypothetical protein
VCGSGRAVVCHSVSGGEVVVVRVLVGRVSMWSSRYGWMGCRGSRRMGLLILFHLLFRCSMECVYLWELRCCEVGCVSGKDWRAHDSRRVAIGEGSRVGVCCGVGPMMCVWDVSVCGLECPMWCACVPITLRLCVLFAGSIGGAGLVESRGGVTEVGERDVVGVQVWGPGLEASPMRSPPCMCVGLCACVESFGWV